MMSDDTVARRGAEEFKARYIDAHPRSRHLYAQASNVLAGGTSHNYRSAFPFPLYFSHGYGAQLWDIDDRSYVDYALNGASAILGHGHRSLVEALSTYNPQRPGATNTELEVEWGNLLKELYPAADLLRFTGSGSEASTLALRLARAYTGREKVARFQRAYHGWHDQLLVGYLPPYDNLPPGISPVEMQQVVTCSVDGDLGPLEQRLSAGDIAALLVEPSGAGMGMNPLEPDKLISLRELARRLGVLFICDENITGLRWAPGGVQGMLDLDPDLSMLGKIATGGFPGGVLLGKAPVMELIAHGVRSVVSHSGTFNGHPITATAAIATILALADGRPQVAAAAYADALKAGLNEVLTELGVIGFAYGPSSTYWLYLHPADARPVSVTPGVPDFDTVTPPMLSRAHPAISDALYCGLASEGVINSIFNGGFASASHGAAELDRTLSAYRRVLHELREARLLAQA